MDCTSESTSLRLKRPAEPKAPPKTCRLQVINQPSAKAARRTEGAAENLQAASQQFGVEVPVPGDFYPDQFVPIAPLDRVGDDLFRASYRAMIGLHLMRLGCVIHLGVEIRLTFEPLANIAFSLFQKIRVNRALLID